MAAKASRFIAALSLGTALAGVPAGAQTLQEAALEARLAQLEGAVAQLRSELAKARSIPAVSATPNAALAPEAEKRLVALETAKPADGFKVGGTTIKLGGFFKATAAFSNYNGGAPAPLSLGRDFYLPSQIPVGGRSAGREFEASAKQTRIWLDTATPINGHLLSGHLEFDFQASPGTQGSQKTTNAYNPALRRGFITYDNLLFGQEWTNFQYVPALPETTDYVGPTEGTVFVRQTQVRYTRKLSPMLTLSVSAENAETASIGPASAATTENGNDRLPDVTARLVQKVGKGEISLAGVARKLTVDTGTAKASATGWGVSLAGKLPFGTISDLRFMVTHGQGIGRYIGLNFAPDAVYPGVGGKLDTAGVTAGFAALRLGWTSTLRSTFTGSFETVDYPNGVILTAANKSSWSAAANLFYSPVKPLDIGIEFRHGVRELFSGAKGDLDRLEFAAKYNF